MKVGSYLATLILACLLGGYFIEFVLSGLFVEFHRASSRHSDDRLWLRDFDRIISDSDQYLISADLVIGSGETYLANGTRAKGSLIAEGLRELQQRNQLLPRSRPLGELANAVTTINIYLGEAESLDSEGRMDRLSLILNRYDPIAFELSSQLDELKGAGDLALANHANKLEELRVESESVKTLTLIGFSLFLLALWYWASRKISMPLRDLRNMAQAAEEGQSFKGVNRGPKEIRQLSNNVKEMTDLLSYQATHDPLTQLLNRRAFDRCLLSSVQNTATPNVTHALCFIDLDRFKAINDTCGHAAGDEFLQCVARLIEKNVRTSDIVARLGGDEFAILLAGCDISAGVEISNKIRVAIRDLKYVRDEQVFRISASIGVTLINGMNGSMAAILNAADTACKFVKDSGRDSVHVFEVDDELLHRKRSEVSAVNQLNTAIDENRFVLFRQKIVPLSDGGDRDNHFELLIRLRSPEGAFIGPGEFLPLVERYDLGKRLDQCVVNTTIDWFLSHPQELNKLNMCAINLSGQSIGSVEFREFIIRKLNSSGFPAEKLCFEVTETAAVTHLGTAIDLMQELRQRGCKFALDDFGSGLSSFAYLKALPVDFIKIDGTFVRDILDDHINYATVKAITDIARALGKRTIAEFVESSEITDQLLEIGVDYAQGYHFGRPELFIDPSKGVASDRRKGSAEEDNYFGKSAVPGPVPWKCVS